MLKHLSIKNIALIDQAEIEFDEGLNILSGETGAGKSMIIDSISVALGVRASKEIIRSGQESAKVSALFLIDNSDTISQLEENGIVIEEDQALLITRTLNTAGKTVCKINGETVTLGMLRNLAESFIDMHGQHEHQSLLNQSKHLLLLDQFCGEQLGRLLGQLSGKYQYFQEISKNVEKIKAHLVDKERQMEFLRFQIEEIDGADLKPGEEEALIKQKKALLASEKLTKVSKESLFLLYDGQGGDLSALDKINQALALIEEGAKHDDTLAPLAVRLNTLAAEIDDMIRELRSYADKLEDDPGTIDDIEDRLNTIYQLKRKYGATVEAVIEKGEAVRQELDLVENSEFELDKLEKEKKSLQEDIEKLCAKISAIRKKSAKNIEKRIETALKELGMEKAVFQVAFEMKSTFSKQGYDRVEFMLSPNAGEAVKPLAKIASGGEMSRMMLAIKSVLADIDPVPTFIFDEIDAGVSGRTAQKVAEKLDLIGKQKQILCITHLPQIAAMADHHFLIEKKASGNKTNTMVKKLEKDACVQEIARLIGGAKITSSTMAAANEMIDMAEAIKNKH